MKINEYTCEAGADDVTLRLDKFLAGKLPELSRSKIKQLILEGNVQRNGAAEGDPSSDVAEGDSFTIQVPPPPPSHLIPNNMTLEILYEDEDLAVINKPVGLTVHPGAGNHQDTLANALVHHFGENLSTVGGEFRLGIVHRLDKDTSGLMVVAKNDSAHRKLADQLQDRSLRRVYWVVVWRKLEPLAGKIEASIGRSNSDRKKMAVTFAGKQAITHYKVLKATTVASLVECRLHTGRTHQIRLHMQHMGHPVIGDQTYTRGAKSSLKSFDNPQDVEFIEKFKRQALHARELSFIHPRTEEMMHFNVTPPEDMTKLLKILDLI